MQQILDLCCTLVSQSTQNYKFKGLNPGIAEKNWTVLDPRNFLCFVLETNLKDILVRQWYLVEHQHQSFSWDCQNKCNADTILTQNHQYSITIILVTYGQWCSRQGMLKRGEYHCTIDLLFDWFGISCMTTDNFCFYLQNRLIQTSQTGGQQYSDTSPFRIPCSRYWYQVWM